MPDITQGLAIVGPGLIGTSVGLARKRRWPDRADPDGRQGAVPGTIGNALVIVLAAPVNVILETIPQSAARSFRRRS